MSFSSAVIVSILFFCIFHASASVTPTVEPVEHSDEFKVHITEKGTKYDEKILIDDKTTLSTSTFRLTMDSLNLTTFMTSKVYYKDLVLKIYSRESRKPLNFNYPVNISVNRVKSKAICYLGPLPEDLPKPADLRTGLERVSAAPSNTKVVVRKYWAVKERVDKTLLRQEVQDFCGQFPVFRLQEVDLSAVAASFRNGGNVGRTRSARNINLDLLPLCDRYSMPQKVCNPNDWLYSFKIRNGGCTYFVKNCQLNQRQKALCTQWAHLFSSMVCYKIRCP
ncbi:hypothetical protein OS493_020659 [Desmophyllum pertusum]|uniref:Uncharacterized protein n=1 Tax=Desmophyllum pertusum TaxID=174260 RepID=A0A9W9YQV2_9CNID|nr:hypothetical protein OS493_020659 [Desmophyllum pertusum]